MYFSKKSKSSSAITLAFILSIPCRADTDDQDYWNRFKNYKWAGPLVAAGFLGGALILNKLFSYIKSYQSRVTSTVQQAKVAAHAPQRQDFPFYHLPREIQIAVLSSNSFQDAITAINSLILVNKALSEQFNNPEFCFYLLKQLGDKFDVSHDIVADKLQIKMMKKIVNGQRELLSLIEQVDYNGVEKMFNKHEQNSNDLNEVEPKIFVNFICNTYSYPGTIKAGEKYTPLSVALRKLYHGFGDLSKEEKENLIKMIELFLKKGADPKFPIAENNGEKIMPLEIAKGIENKEIEAKVGTGFEIKLSEKQKEDSGIGRVVKLIEGAILRKYGKPEREIVQGA